MKLSFLLLFIATLQAMATGHAQTVSLDLNMDNTSMRDVFREIERKTDLSFIFSDDVSSLNDKVSVNVHNEKVIDILDDLFKDTDLGYRILNEKLIVIATKETLQNKVITGTVTDAKGEPLIGVNISIKGTSTGVITDAGGKYTLEQVPDQSILVFSYIGYISQEVKVGNQSTINIRLEEDMQKLNEVVVVGYGTQKKVNLTGAVSVVSGQDISSKATTDVQNALQGQISGLTVLRSSGKPGYEAGDIRIRGFTSANAASALILIDGMEGSLTILNADDIESISVLKDAASASIYGSRAAAGVILVTTKKGAVQRTKVTYNGSFGFNLPGMMPQRVPPWVEQDMINIARAANTGAPEYSPEQSSWVSNPNFNYYPNGTRWSCWGNSNWVHEGTKEYTTQQTHSISVSGGSEKTTYYFSGGFYTKNGILKYGPDDYSRVNLRATTNTVLNKYLDFNLQVSYDGPIVKENPAGNTILSELFTIRGRQPIYLPEEDTNSASIYSADLMDNFNPIQVMKEAGVIKTQNHDFMGNASLRIKNVIKDLTLDLNVSRTAWFINRQENRRYVPGFGRNGFIRRTYNDPNSLTKSKTNGNQDKLEALLNYDLSMNNHHIHILGGASYEQFRSDQISGTAKKLLSNDFFSFNYFANDNVLNMSLSDRVQPWKMASLFGRVNYDFAGRYLLETTLRYDGSSRLAPGNRWGMFPSVSAGWRISEEAFFENAKRIFNNLKLRTSWGQLGNSTALYGMYYPYLGFVSSTSYWGNSVYFQNSMVSNDVTWETVTTTNVGIDVGMLKNRLDMTAEYFWKKNDGMLSQVRVGNIVGFPSNQLPFENAGILKVWGWEVEVNWRDRIGDVSYQVGLNVHDSQNKLIKFAGVNTISANRVNLLEGYPLNSIWGYRTDGFWNSRQEYLDYKAAHPGYETFMDAKIDGGDVRYVAQGKADHTIGIGGGTPDDPGDLILLGNETPRYLFGINLSAQWKGFDCSMFWQGVGQRKLLVDISALGCLRYESYMPWTIHTDYWTKDNPNAYFPRLLENQSYNYNVSDRWLQNGAYIRLKNIQLGYTIPISKKIVNSLRVYVTGTDVWEHTKMFKPFDPEAPNNQGRAYYPFFRTWTMGINLTF